LIDHFPNLISAYQMILEEEAYLVEKALSLEEAYRMLEAKKYSIIITEYIPPFETTDDMIKWVKKNSPETFIIMVTNAILDERTYDKLFAYGVNDLILKPYSLEKIITHIKRGLKQRELILKVQELERQTPFEPITPEIKGYIFNPIFFKQSLRQELKRAKRHRRPLSLLLIKIPTRDKIGDRFENLYIELAKILRRYVREEDIVGRENEHFGLLLPETDYAMSQTLLRRLSKLILDHPLFKSDEMLNNYIQTLPIQSFTYPDQFALPESLKTILEDINKETSHLH